MRFDDYNDMFDYLDEIGKEKGLDYNGVAVVFDDKQKDLRKFNNFKFRDFYGVFCYKILNGLTPFEMVVENRGFEIYFNDSIIGFIF